MVTGKHFLVEAADLWATLQHVLASLIVPLVLQMCFITKSVGKKKTMSK